jgi:RNA polymerase sigma-70 factor (ECF subfamily)
MTVQALRSRRPETLAELLDAHGREIQAVAFLILRDRHLAEDVTIETLLTAFEKAGSIRDDSALRAWLLRVATNRALTMRRRSARIVELSVVPDPIGPGDLARDTSDRIALLAGVAGLPVQMRAAIVLRYYADLPVDEVARALGKSPNTIKAQLQTALDRLRRSLTEPAVVATETRHA